MQTKFPYPRYPLCLLTTQVARKIVAYYNQALSPLGITANQLMALSVLWEENGLSLGVFAGRAGMGKAAAVTMIRRLEAMEMVSIAPHPDDARLNLISLTDKARQMAPEIRKVVGKLDDALEKMLSVSRLEKVVQNLETIIDLDIE